LCLKGLRIEIIRSPLRRFSPVVGECLNHWSKKLEEAGPALEVGSDADRDEYATKRSQFRCGMAIAKHKQPVKQ
jgi:hypothetical protein